MPKKRDKTRPRPANLSPEANALRHRICAGYLRWRNAPPGMSPAMVDTFTARIAVGETIRDLTSPPVGCQHLTRRSDFRRPLVFNVDGHIPVTTIFGGAAGFGSSPQRNFA
jgi:hypothetical protein